MIHPVQSVGVSIVCCTEIPAASKLDPARKIGECALSARLSSGFNRLFLRLFCPPLHDAGMAPRFTFRGKACISRSLEDSSSMAQKTPEKLRGKDLLCLLPMGIRD